MCAAKKSTEEQQTKARKWPINHFGHKLSDQRRTKNAGNNFVFFWVMKSRPHNSKFDLSAPRKILYFFSLKIVHETSPARRKILLGVTVPTFQPFDQFISAKLSC